MNNENLNPADTLNEIKDMMERSSKFISLSGLSGIIIGILAIVTVSGYCQIYGINPFNLDYEVLRSLPTEHYRNALLAAAVLFAVSVTIACILAINKARRMNQQVWGMASKKLFVNMFVPLSVGAVFCLVVFQKYPDLVLPLSLVFYGMSLFNASKYTHEAIRSMGMAEMLLGLLCLLFMKYHIVFWTVGFGLLHVVYGTFMYVRNEQH